MDDIGRKLIEKMHREAWAANPPRPRQPVEPPTIDYRDLPAGQRDSPIDQEWNFYRSQAGRLLAEGHEGHWVLIKGEEIVGIWDTQEEAEAVALKKFLMQPCLIHQVRRREPLIKMPWRYWGKA
jgi:hypothetical protein